MFAISNFFTLLFIVFTMMSTVKVYIGSNLNWLMLLIFLSVATATSLASSSIFFRETLCTRLNYLREFKLVMFSWLLFMTGIVIAALMNDGFGLYTVAKYLVFVIVMVMLIIISPLTPTLLEKALGASLAISLIPLLVLALSRQTDYMLILGDGRMGWLASWPGVIWKVGAYLWPFVVWRCLKKTTWCNLLLAFSSALVMALDGSRTSIVWMALVWCTMAVIAFYVKISGRGVRGHIALLVITLFSFTVLQPTLLNWVYGKYDSLIVELITKKDDTNTEISLDAKDNNIIDDASTTATIINTFEEKPSTQQKNITAVRLINGNYSTRLEMIQTGWHKTVDTFPWGGGFGSTRVMDHGVNSTIHITYLQLLADEGILSFVGYLLFIFVPLFVGLKFIFEKREAFIERFELMMAPLSVLALFIITGCFHPLSNELTDWGIVLVAITLVMTHATRCK